MKTILLIYVIFSVIYFIINSICLVTTHDSNLDKWWFYPILLVVGLLVSIIWPLSAILGIIITTLKLRKLNQMGVK
jgi:hypothetical protein